MCLFPARFSKRKTISLCSLNFDLYQRFREEKAQSIERQCSNDLAPPIFNLILRNHHLLKKIKTQGNQNSTLSSPSKHPRSGRFHEKEFSLQSGDSRVDQRWGTSKTLKSSSDLSKHPRNGRSQEKEFSLQSGDSRVDQR